MMLGRVATLVESHRWWQSLSPTANGTVVH